MACAAATSAALSAGDPPAAAPAREGLLIVTPKALASGLKAFIPHKEARRPTEVVVLEQALPGWPGLDDAERLKRVIYLAWRDRGIGYVLLVGDADMVPVRYMVLDRATEPAFDYAFYPSDLYYADVAKPDGSFEDWNASKDGFHATYFGEVRGEKNKTDPINFDAIDYRPEIAVGRWPVGTPEEVQAVAAFAAAYEIAAEKGQLDRTAAFVHTAGWVDERARVDSWASRLPAGWTSEKRFYKDGNAAFDTKPPTEEELVGLINGGIGLVLHAGHGNDDSWDGCLNEDSIQKLRPEGRVIMMSAGCSTARFATLPPYEAYSDLSGVSHAGTNSGEIFKEPPPAPNCYAKDSYNRTGLGERLVRRGRAVAYIGCNTGSQPCALTLAEGFVDGIAAAAKDNRTARIGDCWNHAVTYYWEHEKLAEIEPTESWYPASIFFQGMKFMLFGDPTLPVPQ